MPQPPPELNVSFLVYADVLNKEHPSLDQITAASGVQPSEASLEEGVFIWQYNYTEKEGSWELPILISEMLDKLNTEAIKSVAPDFYKEIRVAAYVTQESGHPDLHFSLGLIHQIHEADASLDLDIIPIAKA